MPSGECGMTPLHYACQFVYHDDHEHNNWEITTTFSGVDNDYYKYYNRDEQTAVYVIPLLLQVHPAAMQVCNTSHLTPLHIAYFCHAPLPIIKLLVKLYPGAIGMLDWEGYTLLYWALEFK